MKKIVAILLAAMMLLGCVACGETEKDDNKNAVQTPTAEATEQATEAPDDTR